MKISTDPPIHNLAMKLPFKENHDPNNWEF